MYYNYHAKNLSRIKNGELIKIVKSSKEEYEFVLIFITYPYTRPIRPRSAFRYYEYLDKYFEYD